MRIRLLTSIEPSNGNLGSLDLRFHGNTEGRFRDLLHGVFNRDFVDANLGGCKDRRVSLGNFSHGQLNSFARGENDHHDADSVPLRGLGGVNYNGSLLIDSNGYRNKISPFSDYIYTYKNTHRTTTEPIRFYKYV